MSSRSKQSCSANQCGRAKKKFFHCNTFC
jgi:hypothetical protein